MFEIIVLDPKNLTIFVHHALLLCQLVELLLHIEQLRLFFPQHLLDFFIPLLLTNQHRLQLHLLFFYFLVVLLIGLELLQQLLLAVFLVNTLAFYTEGFTLVNGDLLLEE